MNVRVGALIGLIIGYPLSYYFQPGALRAKVSLGQYISSIGDILGDSDLSGTAIGVWIGSVVVCALIGLMLQRGRETNRSNS